MGTSLPCRVFTSEPAASAEEKYAMAEPRFDTTRTGNHNATNPGDAAPKTSGQRARQGENTKGMIWVLIIGVALVVLAYTVMLALSAEPVTVDGRQGEDAAITSPGPAQTPANPSETAPSN
jgi:hypothetical protein